MLRKHQMHASGDPEDTENYLAQKDLRFVPQAGRQSGSSYDSQINTVYGDRLYLSYMEFGTEVEITAPEGCYGYSISLPLDGKMRVESEGSVVECSRDKTVFGSPQPYNQMVLDSQSRVLTLTINPAALSRQFEILTQELLSDSILLIPETDLSTGIGQFIAGQMKFLAEAEDAGLCVLGHRLRKSNFEDSILNAILLYLPHSHSHLLEDPRYHPVSKDVRRVMEYMEAHLDQPITLSDLVTVAGVPARTLSAHFRQFTGRSMMAYLNICRLRKARELLRSGAAQSVLEAALTSGFSHLGRFSGSYREFFGELPSETLKRSKSY